jgi:hypothetical protein
MMKVSGSQQRQPEKLMIPDFKPWGGKHCWTTSLKNIFDYNGLNLSEEMLFGLSGGIGFIYWYMKFMPAPFIGTRYGKGMELLVTTCERIGAKATVFETASARKGYEELKSQLREGEPVLIFADMAYLPYLALPESAHFGAHTVVVFGLDEEQDVVHLADRTKKPQTVSVEDLEKARSSQHPPFASKNRLLRIECPERIGPLEEGIRQSIRDCCKAMLSPPIKNIGLAGLQKWAAIVRKWPRQFKGLGLLGCLFNVFLYIEVGGTGGSGFRSMYAQFLKEARSILNVPALGELAEAFRTSAKAWSEVASAALPDSRPALKRIRELCVEKNQVFEDQPANALRKMQEISLDLDELMKNAAAELEKTDPSELLSDLRQRILACHKIEKPALERLASAIQ